MKYSFLIFDADDTLFDFDKAEAAALEKTFLESGIKGYREETHLAVYRTINGKIWHEFEEEKISAEDLKPERFRRFFLHFGLSLDPEDFSNRYLSWLSTQGILLEGVEELLGSIDGAFTLALLTNGLTSVQFPRFNNSILPNYFSSIVVSESVGVAKPNPKIFEIVFQKADWRDKASALMIGDSLNSDIRGGFNYGIDTCWYNPSGRSNDTEILPTHEVRSFGELLSLLSLN